jgi:hypothetical protein
MEKNTDKTANTKEKSKLVVPKGKHAFECAGTTFVVYDYYEYIK